VELHKRGRSRSENIWKLRCDLCHNDILCNTKKLIKYHDSIRDCGCQTPVKGLRDDKSRLCGLRNGKLLAIKYLRTNENKKMVWLCKCDCGNLVEIISGHFKRNTSCGQCSGIFNTRNGQQSVGEISPSLFAIIQSNASRRQLEFNLTMEYLWNLFLAQNRRCALTGRLLTLHADSRKTGTRSASLDRIDSKIGYIHGNVQWVHKDINRFKNNYKQDYFLQLCTEVYEKNKQSIEIIDRPSWCDYFLGMAFVVAQRSIDAQTKVGAVITDQNHHIISTGYNSFPQGMPDDLFPNLRPEKYDFVLHAEQCAILNANQMLNNPQKEFTLYLTMRPCLNCLKMILNTSIKHIYVANTTCSNKTLENEDIFQTMLHNSKVNLYTIIPDIKFLKNIYAMEQMNGRTEEIQL
jgi:dCMP deaminase